MLWPLILPFKITAAVIAAVIAILTLAAPRFKWRRRPVFFYSFIVGIVAFVPSFAGITSVIDMQRFGTFEHGTFADVEDFRVERYLPPAARDITLNKYGQGFRARFTISQAELDAELNAAWREYGYRSATKRGGLRTQNPVSVSSHEHNFGELDWPYIPDMKEYHGPRAANGAGFTLWYSPSTETAYERADYW